jgi:hypothetical protein
MIRLVLFLLLFVMQPFCIETGNPFVGVPVVAGLQDSAGFDVRIDSNIDQTMRRNRAWNPSFQDVAQRSAVLTERLSGCQVRWILVTFGADAGPVVRWNTRGVTAQ